MNELEHLKSEVNIAIEVHKYADIKFQNIARITPNINDPNLIKTSNDVARAWRNYRVALQKLNKYYKDHNNGEE